MAQITKDTTTEELVSLTKNLSDDKRFKAYWARAKAQWDALCTNQPEYIRATDGTLRPFPKLLPFEKQFPKIRVTSDWYCVA